jgi:hypothetical protein
MIEYHVACVSTRVLVLPQQVVGRSFHFFDFLTPRDDHSILSQGKKEEC